MAERRPNAGRQGLGFLQDFLGNPMGPGMDGLFSGGAGQMVSPMATPPVDVMQMLGADPTGLMSPMASSAGAGGGFMNSLAAAAPGMMLATPLMMTLPKLLGSLATGGTPAKFKEDMHLKKLMRDGVKPTEEMGKFQREMRTDLGSDFVGNDSEGNRVNNKFFNSRDEKDLRGEDLVGRAEIYDRYGSVDRNVAAKLGQAALDGGKVRESGGKVRINGLSPEMDAVAEMSGIEQRTPGGDRSLNKNRREDSLMGRLRPMGKGLQEYEAAKAAYKEKLQGILSGEGPNFRKPTAPELKTGDLKAPSRPGIESLWGGGKPGKAWDAPAPQPSAARQPMTIEEMIRAKKGK
jgi:hypothetical protein